MVCSSGTRLPGSGRAGGEEPADMKPRNACSRRKPTRLLSSAQLLQAALHLAGCSVVFPTHAASARQAQQPPGTHNAARRSVQMRRQEGVFAEHLAGAEHSEGDIVLMVGAPRYPNRAPPAPGRPRFRSAGLAHQVSRRSAPAAPYRTRPRLPGPVLGKANSG